MTLKVKVLIEESNNGFHAFCPDLKGLHVDADSIEETLEVAKDAVNAYIESLIKHGEPITVGCIEKNKTERRTYCSTYINAHELQEQFILATV